MSAIDKVERRVRSMFDLSHVIGVFVMDIEGDTFASMTYPGLNEAENAGKYVLKYYQGNRDSIGTEKLKSHIRGSLTIHMIRGREGAVAIAAQRQANLPGIEILAKKLAGDLTSAVMTALTDAAVVDEERAPQKAKPKSKPPIPLPELKKKEPTSTSA
ncbi:hypothetical protein [Cerasicoccus arenae]|uniref:Uncharacterized protein n=1 Tax=Cerasicoccus arenae TaxID=424488 RepID=A0A8J3DID9_9BACT|nr:hypothetical protein [Cerasicoccus arenae]MBK1856844.1 hypothetical protein [Cerasicoccus arenae]GHC11220.1 hypothetical protein GCM10007047_30670 [Cerasicoccus arenae]